MARFLLYGLATLEAMFDMCLVALATEICLELCSTVTTTELKICNFTGIIPVLFLAYTN